MTSTFLHPSILLIVVPKPKGFHLFLTKQEQGGREGLLS